MTKALLARARHGTPIIDGREATFIWQGDKAPQLIGDFTNWERGNPLDLTEVAPGLWTYSLSLPPDAYIEYAYWDGEEHVADPFNPHTFRNGLGQDNHYFYMPGAAPSPLTRRGRNVPRGTLARHVIEQEFLLAGRRRTVALYQPQSSEPCPLLVVLDGQDYLRQGKVVNVVDNLIAEERIRPIALALIYHGGTARGVEYACSEATLGFLGGYVLPLAQKELNLLDLAADAGGYGILGASMGGLMALFAGLRAPHIFGRILSQSGSFIMGEHDTVVFDLVRHGPVRPLKVWMDVGRYEWLLECNQRMHQLLVEKGYDVTYRAYNGGHNYPAWRNDLSHGLELMFGG